MKEKLWAGASGGLLAGMMLVGANTAFADVLPDYGSQRNEQMHSKSSGMHMMHRFNSISKINALASQLGLDNDTIEQELKHGKTLKQILQERGITLDDIYKAYLVDKK